MEKQTRVIFHFSLQAFTHFYFVDSRPTFLWFWGTPLARSSPTKAIGSHVLVTSSSELGQGAPVSRFVVCIAGEKPAWTVDIGFPGLSGDCVINRDNAQKCGSLAPTRRILVPQALLIIPRLDTRSPSLGSFKNDSSAILLWRLSLAR